MRTTIIEFDNKLEKYRGIMTQRFQRYIERVRSLIGTRGRLKDNFNNHMHYGLHNYISEWVIREYAPNATAIYLVCQSNQWSKDNRYSFTTNGNGEWELQLSKELLNEGELFQLLIEWNGGSGLRLPTYARRVVQCDGTKVFYAECYTPKEYNWKSEPPIPPSNPLIYELHIGISSEEQKVSTFNEFRCNILPRIAEIGYNTIQIMGIQEHPYYGSFGYQVSNFFAVSSRFGTPEELKQLIDEAHHLGISVLMDLVHSHSVSNTDEGLSLFDGSDNLYFHSGEQGTHPAWGSRCFNYGNNTTLNFLLSNCKYWLEEYKLDGFRFDGVTSMLYYDHGLGRTFSGYDNYFDSGIDNDAYIYLMIANSLIHEVSPRAITVAEEVSGMPGIASPVEAFGGGFDFRLNLGIPDYWIKLVEEKRDEDWWIGELFYELTNSRFDERSISYVESHDQAIVGDKTLIFRLIDKDMYNSMHTASKNINIDRGVAIHKMARLLTLVTSKGGYLNFMGNEFGHPEWIDFPRAGNNWSYLHARRLWSLCDNKHLRYNHLWLFDRDMIHLIKNISLHNYSIEGVHYDDEKQLIIFRRAGHLFVFNFSGTNSYEGYSFSAKSGKYSLVLDSDDAAYGGFSRLDNTIIHHTQNNNLGDSILQLYIPSRSVQIYKYVRN